MYNNLNCVTRGFKSKAKALGYDQAWIFKAEKCQRREIQNLLLAMDNIIAQMPDTETEKLAQRFSKIIPDDATEFKNEYDAQFLDALVEVLGYGFLREKYPSHTVCLKEPDLIVRNDRGQLVAAMACKAIRHSDAHDDYFQHHQGKLRPVDHRILSDNSSRNPLLHKVKDTLSKAEKQLAKSTAPNKFILIDFAWDASALLQLEEVKSLVKKSADELRERSIRLIAIENLELDKPFVCM